MKKLILLTTAITVVCLVGNALAVIDWAGQVWPNSGANVVPTGPVDVYAQVYKSGVTDAVGQGPGISAVMSYTTDLTSPTWTNVPMVFQGDAGTSNDEYTAQVPQAALVGAAWVDVDIVFTDDADLTTYQVQSDQAGNPPPFRYNVTDVLPNDIEVGFRLCLSGEVTTGDVCVTGSDPALTSWGSGVVMDNGGSGDLYGVTVVFPAGSNPTFSYKYRKDGCDTWETIPDRVVTLPTDGTTFYPIPAPEDSWNNLPLGCGLGATLDEDKVLCFQVCLSEVTATGGVCVAGNIPELGNWGTGVSMTEIASDLYQACLVFPAGTPIPLNIEYKFKKDDCANWESGGNRVFTLDNGAAYETTLSHTWEDGPGACAPVDTESRSWGELKSQFR